MKIQILIAAMVMAAGGATMAQASGPATPKLDQRQANQQQRIDQGISSGQLNANEIERLEDRASKLAANEAQAKADGQVTRAERFKLQREASRNSAAIRRNKHD